MGESHEIADSSPLLPAHPPFLFPPRHRRHLRLQPYPQYINMIPLENSIMHHRHGQGSQQSIGNRLTNSLNRLVDRMSISLIVGRLVRES